MTLKNDHYSYRGLCAEFPSLSWLSVTPEKALKGIRGAVAECVKDMELNNEPAPEPLASKKFSGKFIVRIPPSDHRELALKAAEAGVSVNRLVSSLLCHA
jgi:predicted HicB family RNase H-like nuclease